MKIGKWFSLFLLLSPACAPGDFDEAELGYESEALLSATGPTPPPLGPAATVVTATTPSFSVSVLRNLIQTSAQESVTRTNEALAASGNSARASLAGVNAWSPYRLATEERFEPNQYFVRSPFGITIDVSIPVVADRTIYLPLDVDVSCEGWYRNAGQVRFVARFGPPSIEGGNILEDVIGIRDRINNEIRRNFTTPSATTLPFGGACATIGAQDGGTEGIDFDAIVWNPPRKFTPIGILKDRIAVTPLSLRRLPARSIEGPVGEPVEVRMLEFWANFHAIQSAEFAMRENDVVSLGMPTIVIEGQPTNLLEVIGNMQDGNLQPTDTGFAVSDRSANYSPGVHTLELMTEVWLPPQPPLITKPTKITVPTYELTYSVEFTPGRFDTVLEPVSRPPAVVSGEIKTLATQ